MYFSHDTDARKDPKIKRLRMQLGAEGYGLFWMIIEDLAESDDYTIEADYEAIGWDLRAEPDIVKKIVCDFGLFVFSDDGKYFYSESLIRRRQIAEEKYTVISNKRRGAAKKRWQKNDDDANAMQNDANAMQNDANAMQKQCKSNANTMQMDANAIQNDANAMQLQCKTMPKEKKRKVNITQKEKEEKEKEEKESSPPSFGGDDLFFEKEALDEIDASDFAPEVRDRLRDFARSWNKNPTRTPLNDISIRAHLQKLTSLSTIPSEQVDIINLAISSGWKGFYAVKRNTTDKDQSRPWTGRPDGSPYANEIIRVATIDGSKEFD